MRTLGPFTRLPLIPEHILRKHKVCEPTDNRFRACARLLQALWREDRDLPIGYHTDPNGLRRQLGSRIAKPSGDLGANFLSPAVAQLVRRETIYREAGAFIDEQRLRCNLLSSMPLTFNLLGPLQLDLDFAARVIHLIVPDLGEVRIRAVRFEHSPGRGASNLTGDSTAFDAFIVYETVQGKPGFIAIETKYSEAMTEPTPKLKPRLGELAQTSSLFWDPHNPELRSAACQQFWREHLLAQALLLRKDYSEGRLIVIAPTLNHPVQASIARYRDCLIAPTHDQVDYTGVALERVVEAIAQAGELDYARSLFRRYCDWWLLDGEIELAYAELSER